MQEPTYDAAARGQRLIELLRGLATRIQELADDQELLTAGPELMKLMGDARSELFHYEVRCTYDSPEVAESRRLVEQAKRGMQALEFESGGIELDPDEDDEPWRGQ